ncbi:MAG: hypothetical protein KIY09_04940 [Thermoplasmata archaeon]|nr:hypothetical protein [Candidatus Sysuiplasma acidicola]MDH2906321.1 hypothetical protein [Methanomassiliicoccales archaeon]
MFGGIWSMTANQPSGSGTSVGEGRVPLEKEMASLIETATHTTVIIALVLFGLLLDFIAEIVYVAAGGFAAGAGSAGYQTSLVLSAFGNFIILAVLFTAGIMKRDASEYARLGYFIAAGLVFVATMRLI